MLLMVVMALPWMVWRGDVEDEESVPSGSVYSTTNHGTNERTAAACSTWSRVPRSLPPCQETQTYINSLSRACLFPASSQVGRRWSGPNTHHRSHGAHGLRFFPVLLPSSPPFNRSTPSKRLRGGGVLLYLCMYSWRKNSHRTAASNPEGR